MSDFVSDAAGGAVGWRLGPKIDRRYTSRLESRSRFECAMRLVHGEPSLDGRWSHGVAGVSAGRLTFSSYLPPGIRIRHPFRRPVDVQVVGAPVIGALIPASTWGPRKSVDVTLETPGGPVEVAVPERSVTSFVAAILPPRVDDDQQDGSAAT